MKQKHWKILSFLMLIMVIGFSVAAFMGHESAGPTAIICLGATISTYGVTKREK